MALYTETLYDYVKGGGTLPSSSFALLGDDFEGLFIGRFAALEIGFETEELFSVRLENKAAIVCPAYAAKLEALANSQEALKLPTKWHWEKRDYGAMHSANSTDGRNTDLPYDVATATPSALSHLEGSADTDAHADTLEHKENVSVDENLRIIEALNKKAFLIVEAALDEFKTLFMGVY